MDIYSIEKLSENDHAKHSMRLGNSSRSSTTIKPVRWKERVRFESEDAVGIFNEFLSKNTHGKYRLIETYTGHVILTKELVHV